MGAAHLSGPESASLRGRRSECAACDDLVAAVRRGESRVLVVRGEAGIGKSALLAYLVGAASDLTIVRAIGVESEMELAFASLYQFCAPMLDRLERLPAPQRDALKIVFGLAQGSVPDRFLVGLAVLSLLSEATGERPVLCVVDDAQWLDHASALTLAFVARRLLAERVGLVFGARAVGDALRGLPELEMRGLGVKDARALLTSAVRFPLDEQVRDRIVAETRGNPLALLELPRGLTAAQLAGGFGLPGAQALSGRIEESFARRLGALPEQPQRLLLLAAAEPTGDPLLVWCAAERLGIPVAVTAETETSGLLTFGEQVTFRHPLVRSAVYRSAAAEERRAVHLALADVTDRQIDPDRRAWHLAAATSGPSEEIASELERSAGRAQARGGLAAAAAFLQRSVALTGDPGRRADRALAAARANLYAGAFDTALTMLSIAEAGSPDEFQRARAELLRAQIAFSSNIGSDAPPLLVSAARRLERLDPELARETYLDAWGAAMFAGRLAAAGGLLEVSRAARAAPAPTHVPHPSDLLLDALALLITEGRAAAASALRRASEAFAGTDDPAENQFRWTWLPPVPSYVLWDDKAWYTINARQLQLARGAGALARIPMGLITQAVIDAWSGEFTSAAAATAEAEEITEATGIGIAPYGAMLLAALRGREADGSQLLEPAINAAAAVGQGFGVQWGEFVKAILFNGLRRYEQALAAAQRASDDTPQLFIASWALAELIEAASRSGQPELGVNALGRLTEDATAAGTDWGAGVAARSRALLCEGAKAERLYREAVERLERTRLRPELARAHLLYGEWLRREHRRVDARAQLRTAHEMFGAIGMEAFTERARRELAATGETVRKRTVETSNDLTPHEMQIARLVCEGLSNAEIGARLFISPRTVEWHLHKVFEKLSVNSRTQLARVLTPA
jgi:DNA-binding CsgD family transcriptional regulator/tetratricopeptide (TPR) repeat protein